MIIEEHLDFQQWEGTNNLKEAHKTQNTVVGRIPRCLPPLLRRNSKSLWFHLLWLTYHNLLHPECQHTEIALCSCSLYSWYLLVFRVISTRKSCCIEDHLKVLRSMTFYDHWNIVQLVQHVLKIRGFEFHPLMKQCVRFSRIEKGRPHQHAGENTKKKRWLCIRQDVKSQSERGICFEFCFVLSFDALCTGNECWPKSSLMLGRPIVCNLGTTRKEWTKANVIDVIWLFRYSPRWGWRVWLPLGSSRTKPRKLAPCDFELKAEICFSNPGWKIVHVTLSAVVSLEWKLQR